MLIELRIRNFAIIDSLHLNWNTGFTVITGETGAGKTIIINALKTISGARIDPELIRKGSDKLNIEAVFDVPESDELSRLLDIQEIDTSENELILERELFRGGKNRCRINGSIVSLATMKKAGGCLLDLHGQHKQQSLLDQATHLSYIDRFGKLEALQQAFAEKYRGWKSLLETWEEREHTFQKTREQQDFFSFQYKELEEAGLRMGEEEQIEERLAVFSNLEKTTEQVRAGLALLEDDRHGIMNNLSSLRDALAYLESRSSALSGTVREMEDAKAGLTDILRRIQAYEIPQEADPETIDALNARLAFLQKLKSKYKLRTAGLIELREKRKHALDMLLDYKGDGESLKSEIETAFASVCAAARALSARRKKAGKAFEKLVNSHLSHLGMEKADFTCQWKEREPLMMEAGSLFPSGMDRLEFLLSANPGEGFKPLHRVASGGESSRIMLAIKTALAGADPVPLMVFDEIDLGIGGITANRIGEALQKLSDHHQIMVITHLHQVAARASHQVKVLKSSSGGRTLTLVKLLTEAERIPELARMMGDETSQATLKHARQLLTKK
ncbi:DNA repair protein RecN [Fibrobacterota bacterium]